MNPVSPRRRQKRRLVRQPPAVEVHALQVAHQDLLRLRVLELRHHAHEVGEPLAVHAAAAHLSLAEVEELAPVERRARPQLQRRHDELVRDRARHAVRRGEHDVGMLLEQAGHLERGEVLAVLADPVVGPAVEEEVAASVALDHVAEVSRVVHAVAILAGVRVRVVEVALEEPGVRRDATDLADRLGVVGDLAVGIELRRRDTAPPRSFRICTLGSVISPTEPRGSLFLRNVLMAASVEP